MSRQLRLSKHGNSVCVPITREAEELGWHPDTKVEVCIKNRKLVIEEVAEVA
jgi:antitoxin component of MazEF toxin-antitoxin module